MEGKDDHRRSLGRKGEDIACELLRSMGHIISLDPSGIHFVEVKARRDSIQAPPQYNVDKAKQSRIVKASLGFLNTRKGLPFGNLECHFDIVAVTFEGGSCSTEWFPQAYIPIYV